MYPSLQLYEDAIKNDVEISLPARPRMIFVVHGSITSAGHNFRDEDTWSGEDAITFKAGTNGAMLWRWEFVIGTTDGNIAADGAVTCEKLTARLDTAPKGELLLRGDSVAFPSGGCAYLHRHQGPGIRCLIEGAIRIDTRGRSTSYGPGGAWYETGPDAVFAQAADRPTRFIRVMILPRSYLGKSSIEYVREQDKAKPKSQSYKIYVDMPLGVEAMQ